MLSNLDIVVKTDSSPYRVSSSVYEFLSSNGTILGKVLPYIAHELALHNDVFVIDNKNKTLQLQPFSTEKERSKAIAQLMHQLRTNDTFEVLRGWRDELYPVYLDKSIYFLIERSGACLLGLVTYGVHINGYIPASSPQDYKFWVPKRSLTKQTYPGMLDNTIAGGLGHPHGPWETCIKESGEEAGLERAYVEQHLRPAGVVTYEFVKRNVLDSEEGVFQPECEYIYDLEFVDGKQPKPADGEVAEFNLMSLSEVRDALGKGEFKYNCGLVLIDFFVRHGIITPDDEPGYLEIVQRCHRALPYPMR